MKRKRDKSGRPILTKAEWHRGYTPEDIEKVELLKSIAIFLAILATAFIILHFT